MDCHTKVTPGIVPQWLAGKMGQTGIDCASCRSSDYQNADDVAKAKLPTSDTCKACRAAQVEKNPLPKGHRCVRLCVLASLY
jgi:hydroxylamine dehydrogenase